MNFCIRWASCDRFVDFDAIVMEFKLGFIQYGFEPRFPVDEKDPLNLYRVLYPLWVNWRILWIVCFYDGF
jgi:hypothetical protein